MSMVVNDKSLLVLPSMREDGENFYVSCGADIYCCRVKKFKFYHVRMMLEE